MLPNVPTERMVPTRVANFSGGNRNMKIFIEPIRTGAIPNPISILPKRAEVKDPLKAKRKAPKAPIKAQKLTTMRGPIRSSIGPIGI